MDSLDRIFNLINEAKKPKMKKGKACIPTSKKPPKGKPTPKGAANRYDSASFGKSGKKVNASTEIANILNLIKEAYQDELISEEAFLAIADPIMRSLMEEEKEPGYEGHGTPTMKRSRSGQMVPKPKTTPAAGEALGASIRKKAAKYVDKAAKKAF